MTPPERLFLPRVRGTTLHLLLLGLLLVLQPGAQGLPGVGLTPSAAQTAHQHPKMHLAHSTLKPAAHLIGDPSKQNSLLWRANTDRAFLQDGFSLSNNSLLVPTSGIYFVYSQVVFSGKAYSPKATSSPLYLAHEVQLFSSQYPFHVPLLSSQKMVYPGLQEPWLHSMYHGAAFQLTQGDQLSTHTDGIPHLVLSPSTVFFGAFAL
ncbi:lymphotoxin-alpha [Gorilla gorilla gorilla]|uniref:lymphotoxin-alpha n=1 Tax=Gorilla gorilla gorilla TaxID=9595 RepID=UPI002445B43F|nr:lymphotoxin-alpha [Gorilla gorilla gorilla]XP_055245959.1 lymphotoxin-alpha [Gorilla gorilla gorilla]